MGGSLIRTSRRETPNGFFADVANALSSRRKTAFKGCSRSASVWGYVISPFKVAF